MAETGMKWYVMRAISGKEGKVKEYVDALLQQGGSFAQHVSQVLIPTEKVVTVVAGKRKIKEKNRFPGYVFVEADFVGETQQILRNVPNVLGFLCATKGSTDPMALLPAEVNQMLGTVDELAIVPEVVVIPYEVGDKVKVIEGPFSGFEAVVEEVNSEKHNLKVSTKFMGRIIPVELGYTQVEKQ